MNLTTQKRLAASILKVGLNRVWIDPERMEEVSIAITREGVKQLINDGAIKAKPQKGISSYRSKKLAEQKKKGKRRKEGRKAFSVVFVLCSHTISECSHRVWLRNAFFHFFVFHPFTNAHLW